jgi:hypothetical protein
MSLKTCIVLNWNSQDLKIDQQPPEILPGLLLLVFVKENGLNQGDLKIIIWNG